MNELLKCDNGALLPEKSKTSISFLRPSALSVSHLCVCFGPEDQTPSVLLTYHAVMFAFEVPAPVYMIPARAVSVRLFAEICKLRSFVKYFFAEICFLRNSLPLAPRPVLDKSSSTIGLSTLTNREMITSMASSPKALPPRSRASIPFASGASSSFRRSPTSMPIRVRSSFRSFFSCFKATEKSSIPAASALSPSSRTSRFL
mmetsp:Transcript_88451/g.184845  ORF Transcript_88451/g.184845 Transcript_88451/m.184845 type:complete len:202 (-) Transcript_88451:530-1135(-)